MIELVQLVYNQTFKLLDITLKKKTRISNEDFNTIVDNYINLFKIVNNAVGNEYIDENVREKQILTMNDEVIHLSEGLRLKIKKNRENYIIDDGEQEKENNKPNKSQTSNKKKEILGDNDDDVILRDETQKNSVNSIYESAIKFLLNESSTDDGYTSFKDLILVNEYYFKILSLDMTKDMTYYKTNYIFKSGEGEILYKIYKNLKDDENLKKAIMIEINVEDNYKLYYLMLISHKEFRIKKFMKYYFTNELDSLSIENRFELIEKRGKVLFKEIKQKPKAKNNQ